MLLYGKKFSFIKGDSTKILRKLIQDKTLGKFDLIYIDGGHSFKVIQSDLKNCFHLAHEDTIVWIDDFGISSIKKAVNQMVNRGKLKIVKVCQVSDRSFVVAKFIK